MKVFTILAVTAVALLGVTSSMTINEASIVGSVGKTEDDPVEAETDFTLRCSLGLGEDESWSSCLWEHRVENRWGANSNFEIIMCSAGDPNTDQGKTCMNNGGTDDLNQEAQRITMDVGTNYCGIRISDANYIDNGEWECFVGDGMSTPQTARIEVFVANMSQLFIIEPDLEDDPTESIVYDLKDDRKEIEAECRAVGSIPEPEFHWYLNDDRNEIDMEDLTTNDNRGEIDGVVYYDQRITWEPTLEDLCEKYDLDEDVCEHDKHSNRFFEMQLICKVEQGNYFQSELDDESVEVTIEVVDAASSITVSLTALTASVIFALMRQ